MKKYRLKKWVITLLITWGLIDFTLITLALYMQRVLELGWV